MIHVRFHAGNKIKNKVNELIKKGLEMKFRRDPIRSLVKICIGIYSYNNNK